LDRIGNLYVTTLDGSTRKIPHLDALSATASNSLATTESGKRLPTATSFDSESGIPTVAKSPIEAVGPTVQPGPIATVKWTNQRIEDFVFLAELAGETGAAYEIQRTTNLLDWLRVETMVCKDGVIHFADKQSPYLPQCLYRAVKRP